MRLRNLFKKKTSREIAKDRLKILLISDRAGCSPEMLEMIKQDIAKVISKYMKIDTNNMEIQISKSTARGRGKNPTLYADIFAVLIIIKLGHMLSKSTADHVFLHCDDHFMVFCNVPQCVFIQRFCKTRIDNAARISFCFQCIPDCNRSFYH